MVNSSLAIVETNSEIRYSKPVSEDDQTISKGNNILSGFFNNYNGSITVEVERDASKTVVGIKIIKDPKHDQETGDTYHIDCDQADEALRSLLYDDNATELQRKNLNAGLHQYRVALRRG